MLTNNPVYAIIITEREKERIQKMTRKERKEKIKELKTAKENLNRKEKWEFEDYCTCIDLSERLYNLQHTKYWKKF